MSTVDAGTPVVALEHVGVSLGGRRVLDDVSFSIGRGEMTGLIGANGAGKTTILRSILGLQALTQGRIEVEGVPVGRGRRRRSVGYVPQKVLADADVPLRSRDLVALGIDGERLGPRLGSKARRAQVDQVLGSVGATAFADARIGTLSGGELQRVLIAHALVRRPRLLLLDEPLANLDLRSGQEIVSILGDIAGTQGVSVLLSAHDVNPLLPVMDRVVYVAGGRVASGPTDEVIREDVLSSLYGHPVHVLEVEGRVLVVAGAAEECVHGALEPGRAGRG